MKPSLVPPRTPRRRTHGATLIIGMVLLLLMTAISLTSLKAIKTDERLAGNLQDRYLAFQAAESALRDGERFLEKASLPRFANTAGLYLYTYSSIPAPLDLDSSNAMSSAVSLTDVHSQPLYTLEQMEAGVEEGDSLVLGVRYGGERRPVYRITALGFGGSATTRAALQSTFRR